MWSYLTEQQFVPGVEQDTTMFENPSFTEVFRSLSFQLRVVEVQDAPHLSSAPIIRFVGEMEYGVAMMEGTAKLMADGNVHWSFVRPLILVTRNLEY
jgi:hypothetical protein